MYTTADASVPLQENTVIIHVVNTLGKWGKGFVLSLSKHYPNVKSDYLDWSKDKKTFELGNNQIVAVDENKKIFVVNMLAQNGIRSSYKDKSCYLDYSSLRSCLGDIANFVLEQRANSIELTVQMPRIGAGLAGGNWNKVELLILEELICYGIKCVVCDLE